MARKARTETISLRVDPRTKFIIEFLAREWKTTSTSAIERCIHQIANTIEIGRSYTPAGQLVPGNSWKNYWDTEAGIRQIKLLADESSEKSFEEEEVLDFIKWHIEFFSTYNRIDILDRARVSILWPKIDEYVAMWLEKEDFEIFATHDIWAAGKIMAKALKDSGIDPPKWPRRDTTPPVKLLTPEEQLDIDEIPF